LEADDYFRLRDFEYVQPLYDLAFLLEVDAIAKGKEIPKYRTFSLWRAGYSLDGYGTTIDQWLDGALPPGDLDYLPSSRIREYLLAIRQNGTLDELQSYSDEPYRRCLRLRSMRGLGPRQIAATLQPRPTFGEWLHNATVNLGLPSSRITALYNGSNIGPWQSAHVVPPLFRLLKQMELLVGESLSWTLLGVVTPFSAITNSIIIHSELDPKRLKKFLGQALKRQPLFSLSKKSETEVLFVNHQMGWKFEIRSLPEGKTGESIEGIINRIDPLANRTSLKLEADLHTHTAWSDGSASVNTMALASAKRGLKYLAITDHSRSSKLQGGLTPILWLRQANALALTRPVCPILHGIEVDILKDGSLDLPLNLLRAADLVIGSVHSNWTDDPSINTGRLTKAIETGCIDIVGHPTSAVIGKPGVPDYVRPPAEVFWDDIFLLCSRWNVALEFNCFPSRLDLSVELLRRAIDTGCAISFGSDAHARSHLINLQFGEAILAQLDEPLVLNRLTFDELRKWVAEGRQKRNSLQRSVVTLVQSELGFDPKSIRHPESIKASIQLPRMIPTGSKIVGIDLTAGEKATGVATLEEFNVMTCSLTTDEQILNYVKQQRPSIVSIDSPLGLPGGGAEINKAAGIMRVAEFDLASVGIPAYPALIDSMRNLTLRGIKLRKSIEQLENAPRVIESYPGAAQDILCIPRKQKSLDLLREGLTRLGLTGNGLATKSHDEMDAITSAIVGRYFESNNFEPMGIPSEAQLIVPKVPPLAFERNPVICLAGKTGVGKSVIARYLSVFYGLKWIRTRDIIRELLIEDSSKPPKMQIYQKKINATAITEEDLRAFGTILLNDYKQIPVRQKLEEMIRSNDTPLVVDSIRDIVDCDKARIHNRPVLIWFVDCSDPIIHSRLSDRAKLGIKKNASGSPVDRTASLIQNESDDIIQNMGSLEELRWKVDDTLFKYVNLTLD
jgi:histidinol phosphatase-like PHP family hydrolase/predicted nuclease with RNAse H fold/dephospho-CoA kinase